MSSLVSLDEIRRAAATLAEAAVATPLLLSHELTAAVGVPVFLKPEVLQRGGSFKFRGAYWFVSQLSDAERARGLVAPSSGNHGRAVALAAQLFGAPATVVMPTIAPQAKIDGVRRAGAKVEFAGTTTTDRMTRALEICDADGMTLVPSFDDMRIITGQGTMGLEIVDDLRTLYGITDEFTVVMPVGGGGLSAGVSAAVKRLASAARLVAVEPAGSPKLTRGLAAGEPVTIPANDEALADALNAVRIGTLPFAHHQAFIDDVLTVDDRAIASAMKFLLERDKLLAEPAGAITVAALREGLVQPTSPVVCVISGGNVDWDGLIRVLAAV